MRAHVARRASSTRDAGSSSGWTWPTIERVSATSMKISGSSGSAGWKYA
jgi:hypothetical protein